MLFRLAWRNIWRNKRRTLITILAMSLGVMGIVSLHSYQRGAYDEMIAGLTTGLVGHVQVVAHGYHDAPDIAMVVTSAGTLEERIRGVFPDASVEQRVLGASLAGSGEASAAVAVMGVDPASLQDGGLFTIESGRPLHADGVREIVVARGLAKELGVAPGDELVLFGQAADGSLANDRFTIVGIGDAGSSEANATTVFLSLAEAQSFFSLGDGAHQIIVRLGNPNADAFLAASQLRALIDPESVEVLTWGEVVPELKKAMEQKMSQQHFVDFIIFLIVGLGVLNTMTMSTFERTREFGIMAALGTRRGRILNLVVAETILQGVIAFLVGLAAAYGLLVAIGPIDLTKIVDSDVLGARMPERLVMRIHAASVFSAGVTTFLTMLAGGLLPAFRASRLKPAEAARYV
jgi:ABC-type lipoprotein release transport system permease subunit